MSHIYVRSQPSGSLRHAHNGHRGFGLRLDVPEREDRLGPRGGLPRRRQEPAAGRVRHHSGGDRRRRVQDEEEGAEDAEGDVLVVAEVRQSGRVRGEEEEEAQGGLL